MGVPVSHRKLNSVDATASRVSFNGSVDESTQVRQTLLSEESLVSSHKSLQSKEYDEVKEELKKEPEWVDPIY